MAYGMNRAAVMGGVGQGLEKAAGNIMNAYLMKKKLDVSQQVADAQKLKAQADTRKSDAYTNYLNNQDILKQLDAAHGEVPAVLQALMAKRGQVSGPGSTANQLATRYAPMPGEVMSSDGLPSAEGPGLPRGMARAQANPASDRSAVGQFDRMPYMKNMALPFHPPAQARQLETPMPEADPRNLVAPQPFDRPMFADDEA
ncbi:MAG: hypothetical protein U0361_22880 [Nitrospiraceae bacterium]